MSDLGTLGGPDATANFINERGQVTGVAYTNSTPNPETGIPTLHSFVWQDGKMRDLATLGGTLSFANAFNNRGQVAGQSSLKGDLTAHPFLWGGESLRDLGTLGGSNGIALWMNDGGEVVGQADLPGDEIHRAFFWKKGVMTDMGSLGEDPCSVAHFMNEKGQVVGASTDCSGTELHGFLWQSGGPMIDLNVFVPPSSDLVLTSGETINDRGEIAGSGMLPNGDFHAIVLIPCDTNSQRDESCRNADARAASRPLRSDSTVASVLGNPRKPGTTALLSRALARHIENRAKKPAFGQIW